MSFLVIWGQVVKEMGGRLDINAFESGMFYCFLEMLVWNISWYFLLSFIFL